MGGWMTVTGTPEGGPQMVGDNIGDSVPRRMGPLLES